MPPKISLYELYSLKKKKEENKSVSFDKILEICHAKIKKVAEAGGMNVFFEVPNLVIGLPLYNINKCIEYIVDCLRKNGLLVQIIPYPNNNIIYISWNPFDISPKHKKYLENSDDNRKLLSY